MAKCEDLWDAYMKAKNAWEIDPSDENLAAMGDAYRNWHGPCSIEAEEARTPKKKGKGRTRRKQK